IWTSGEPVSASARPCCLMISCFSSLVRVMVLLSLWAPPSQRAAQGRRRTAATGSEVSVADLRGKVLSTLPRVDRQARFARVPLLALIAGFDASAVRDEQPGQAGTAAGTLTVD